MRPNGSNKTRKQHKAKSFGPKIWLGTEEKHIGMRYLISLSHVGVRSTYETMLMDKATSAID